MATRTLYVDDGYFTGDNYTQTGVTIDWGPSVIFVPKIAMELVQLTPTLIYSLDLNVFRLALKELEESSDGMAFTRTHKHNTAVSVGGVDLARVLEIITPYTVTFEDDQYAVNLINANSNVGDRVNVNQVSVRSSNSAGLTSNLAIEYSEFDGAVHWNQVTGSAGTAYPKGTPRAPSNNGSDTQLIADVRGFSNIYIHGNITVYDDHSEMKFIGRSPRTTSITIDGASTLFGCEFSDLLLSGDLADNGTAYFTRVACKNVSGIFGHLESCIFREGTNTVYANGLLMANRCAAVSAINPGVDIPIIDCNGTGRLAFRELSGEVTITNKTAGTAGMSLSLSGAKITLDSTITYGTWRVFGVGTCINNTTGTATVDVSDLIDPASVSQTNADDILEQVKLSVALSA